MRPSTRSWWMLLASRFKAERWRSCASIAKLTQVRKPVLHDRLKAVGSPANGLKRFVFWDYPRAGWQYDIMVGVILLFIFLTPREWFRDQPRASSIVMVQSPERGTSQFWIEPAQLEGVPEAERTSRAEIGR